MMFFPQHNPGLWATGNQKTQAPQEALYSYYKPGIDSAAPKVFALMQQMSLGWNWTMFGVNCLPVLPVNEQLSARHWKSLEKLESGVLQGRKIRCLSGDVC